MKLQLQNDFTDEVILVSNVNAFFQETIGTRVYTELNGNKDMTTYKFWFVVSASA